MIPDVNILVSAARLEHPHHTVARGWLHNAVDAARTTDRLGLLPAVIAGFLRITTNTKVFPSPTPIEAAIQFIDGLLQYPGVIVLSSGPEWSTFKAVCLEGTLVANAIPDAWIAAQVLHHGDTLATFDRDFSRLLPQHQLQLLTAP